MTQPGTIAAIVAWSQGQFPTATPTSTLHHLRKELAEIDQALAAGDLDAAAMEFIDVLFLAAQGAQRCGCADPDALARQKLALNRARRWGPPDAQGVVEHVHDTP